jgi:hypothetical protein
MTALLATVQGMSADLATAVVLPWRRFLQRSDLFSGSREPREASAGAAGMAAIDMPEKLSRTGRSGPRLCR